MTKESLKQAQELNWNIETMENNIASDVKDFFTITMTDLDKDVVKRWEEVNEAFWVEEIEKARKKFAEL